jgi:hypothetical protein
MYFPKVQFVIFLFFNFCQLSLANETKLQEDLNKLNQFQSFTETLLSIEERKYKEAELVQNYRTVSDQWKRFYSFQRNGLELYYESISLDEKKSVCENSNLCSQIETNKKQVHSKVEILFSVIAKNRINILKKLRSKGLLFDIEFNKDLLEDIFHEVKTVPYRWISKISYQLDHFNKDIQAGYHGWIKIFKQLLLFLVYIVLGVLLHKASSMLLHKLNEIKKIHARSAYRNKRSALITKSINLYSNFLPWVILILYFNFLQDQIEGSYFNELGTLIPFFIIYAYYRILKIVINKFFSSFTRGVFSPETRKKLSFTVNYLSQLFLYIAILLHLFKSAGGEGILYYIIQSFIIYITIFNIFYIANKWDKELWKYIETNISLISPFLLKLNIHFLKFLVHPLLFLIIALHKLWIIIYDQLEKFDFVKALSAKFFRKQIDIKRAQKTRLIETIKNDHYYNSFMYSEITSNDLNQNQTMIFNKICSHIDQLFKEEDHKTVHLITGESGIGKSTILDLLSEKYKDNSFVKYISLNQRSNINKELDDLKTICDSDSKKIIIIDNIQYLFISKLRGFEKFKEFLEVLSSENSQNFAWVLSINNYSWEFIEAVLKKNRYFNSIYNVDKWSEDDIAKLILSKNKTTGLTIKYDHALSQANIGLDDISQDSQNKYFRLLWEEAMGNPSKAKEIWLDSIEKVNEETIYAYIPDEIDEKFEDLPNDYYFILANIVRHESINLENIIKSTCLSEDIVKNALRTCIDLGLIDKTSNQYSINLLKQHSVYSTLRRMNFIYG